LTNTRQLFHNKKAIVLLSNIISLRDIKALGFYFFTRPKELFIGRKSDRKL
jgi:hypothetical protein